MNNDEIVSKIDQNMGKQEVLCELMQLIVNKMEVGDSDAFRKWQFAFDLVNQMHDKVMREYKEIRGGING